MDEAKTPYRETVTMPKRPILKPLTWGIVFKLTPSGKYLFLGVLFACFSATASIDIPVFHFACALIGVFCICAAAGWLFRPRLRMRVMVPDRMTAGETVRGMVAMENRGRLGAYDLSVAQVRGTGKGLTVEWEEALRAAPCGESAEIAIRVRAARRGRYEAARLAPCSSFPMGLVRTAGRLARESEPGPPTMLVYPRFQPLVAIDLTLGSRHQPGGIALTSHIGESPEYIGNREYRAGDPFRRIDFRSWGRLARPVVREYQEEYYCRVALVLDTFVPRRVRIGAEGDPGLEGAVSLSAAVGDALARDEYVIDLFAAGPELYVFRSGRHTSHFENVLEILAGLDACRENPFGRVAPALAEELNRISAVICVLLDWDETRETMVRAAAEAGCAVKIAIVRKGPTSRPLDSAERWAHSVVHLSPEDVVEGRVERL